MQRMQSVRQQDVDDLSGEDMGCDSLKHSGSCMGSQVDMTVFSGRFDSLVGALRCCWTCGVIARKLDHALARKFNPPMHSLLFCFGHASPMCLCLRDFVFVFDVMCFVGLLLCFCVFVCLRFCGCLFFSVCVFACLCVFFCVCVFVFSGLCFCVLVDFCGFVFVFMSLCLCVCVYLYFVFVFVTLCFCVVVFSRLCLCVCICMFVFL